MLALSREDVRRLVPMPVAIALMKTAFAELSAGRAASPLRTVIPLPEVEGDALFMPARVPAANALGVKVVSVVPVNRARDLPVIHAIVCLIDDQTGRPLAIMDGTYLTALRTGAVSGAATDLLARPDSRVLVAIGAGAQGATQIAAVCAVRPIERVIAVDVGEPALLRLREAMARDWPDLVDRLETTTDAASAVRLADVVCTATTSKTPVFDDADLRPGTHVNAVGAYTPEMQEIPAATVLRAAVTVDAIDAALAEAGDLIAPLRAGLVGRDHFVRELGMVVAGSATGRTDVTEITLFKSVGNAVQDIVVARRAIDRAREMGVGTTVDLG
ncbi:MAG: Ornithine cyclodeaminase [uncultured Thermomicrobiales bacterium]|uniref:Delta(1)-pyrroline-2-carboxylate reductase n=1 Tax=uncultured Thermomicrobiales bacterium TaxID=1645740 RepID=A0A6J4UBZ3_9BACT|nr:MAG: Ornithine cyclodeaminase [uncultured Thermomicrobiales bacterium]